MSTSRRGPKPVSEVIAELFARRGLGRVTAAADWQATWQAAVGDSLAGHTRAGTLRRGVLQVTVSNSTQMQELMFQKAAILERLNAAQENQPIDDLRFRVGVLE